MISMDMLGIVLMWFFNILTSKLRADNGAGEFNIESITDIIETVNNVTNIFAWVDMFVPVNFLVTLALLTTVFYSYKFIVTMVRYIISLFKR